MKTGNKAAHCVICGVALWILAASSAWAGGERLEPLPVPEWVQQCTRALFTNEFTESRLDQYQHDGYQAIFNVGIYLVYLDNQDHYYLAQPDAQQRLQITPLSDEEFKKYQEQVKQIHARDLKAIGTMPPMWGIQVLNDHPDWQRLGTSAAKPRDALQGYPPPGGCWTSPFGDWYIHKNIKMVQDFGWDGQNIDGFGTYTLCYCDYCKKAYAASSGGATIPEREDPTDPNYRRYLRWRLEAWGEYVHKWEAALKQVNPDFAFIPWSTGPGRWWHWTALPRVEGSELGNLMVDAPIMELFWDFPPDQSSNLLPSFNCNFYRGFCEQRPVWMCVYPRSQGQQNAITPPVECDFRFLTALSNGTMPVMATWFVDRGDTDQNHYIDLMRAREKFLIKARPQKWAAMLVSENSRLFYGIPGTREEMGGPWAGKGTNAGFRGEFGGDVIGSGVDSKDISKLPPSQRRMGAHLEAAIGFYRAAREAHLPLDFISDRMLDDPAALKDYRVLALPDAACLSDKALANVRAFVNAGGGLVATEASSLFDENGAQRADFGLADLYQAHFKAFEDHTASWPQYDDTASVTFAGDPKKLDPVIRHNFTPGAATIDFIGWTLRTTADAGTSVTATFNSAHKPEASPFAMMTDQKGGRVAYFAAAVDQSYFVSPYQYERPLLVNALRWAAGTHAPPIEVEAPMSVQATFFEQENGKRLIVHLLNETNTTANRALPANNPSMREEIAPIADIKVRFRDFRPKLVRLEPEHLDLPMTEVAGMMEVTVPKLMLHSMVVAE